MHRTYRFNGGIKKIALIGNHLPRRCGIATFTSDLADAIREARQEECIVLAMNEAGREHDYPPRVELAINEGDVSAYRRAADFLNVKGVDVVSLQHEYGIFGGRAGALVLDVVRELRMPVVTTLHTVLGRPSPAQRAVMDELLALSARVVVMSSKGVELLREVHGADPAKIDLIPHGIPAFPSDSQGKHTLGLQDNDVILTFGLLSPDKGIEHVIDALPEILAARPNAVYVVLGVTHPHVKERQGEAYRYMLEARAKRLGVESSIVFHDRFVSHEELVQFLAAADIYVTPYLNTEQITSGTLAQAVGFGRAVISTPYPYATELLAGGRGVIVPPRDSKALAIAVLDILENPSRRRGLETRAAEHGRSMGWPVVARAYVASFERANDAHGKRLASSYRAKTLARRSVELPEIDLTHVRLMTDDTGILQHATFCVPRRSDGYCLDDNARALLLTAMLEDAAVEAPRSLRALATSYLAFVDHALDEKTGRFRNFMTFAREWVDAPSPDDCHGRALWALGAVIGRSADRSSRGVARRLWHAALPLVTELTSPRAWAYAILGIDEYLRACEGDHDAEGMMSELMDRLAALFLRSSTAEWPWFEDRLTYANARLAQALIVAGARLRDRDATSIGLRALEWLCSVQTIESVFAPIGSNGFWVHGDERAVFDQQPLEAASMISACLDAHRVTGDTSWVTRASRAFQWFLGQNQLELPLYDPVSGGCRDGLHADRVNENQGAESTLSFALALLEMRAIDKLDAATTITRPARTMVAPPAAAEQVSS